MRGYRANRWLFADTTWRRVGLEPGDFALLRYCNPTGALGFVQLSGGTRRVVDAAASFDRIETDASPHVRAVVEALRAGEAYEFGRAMIQASIERSQDAPELQDAALSSTPNRLKNESRTPRTLGRAVF